MVLVWRRRAACGADDDDAGGQRRRQQLARRLQPRRVRRRAGPHAVAELPRGSCLAGADAACDSGGHQPLQELARRAGGEARGGDGDEDAAAGRRDALDGLKDVRRVAREPRDGREEEGVPLLRRELERRLQRLAVIRLVVLGRGHLDADVAQRAVAGEAGGHLAGDKRLSAHRAKRVPILVAALSHEETQLQVLGARHARRAAAVVDRLQLVGVALELEEAEAACWRGSAAAARVRAPLRRQKAGLGHRPAGRDAEAAEGPRRAGSHQKARRSCLALLHLVDCV